MIVIEVIFEALAGKRDEFIALSRRTIVASEREKGCVLYRFTSDIEHALRFNLIEIWKTEEDLKAHFQGDAFKNFFAELPNIGRSVSYLAWQGTLSPYVPPIGKS